MKRFYGLFAVRRTSSLHDFLIWCLPAGWAFLVAQQWNVASRVTLDGVRERKKRFYGPNGVHSSTHGLPGRIPQAPVVFGFPEVVASGAPFRDRCHPGWCPNPIRGPGPNQSRF